MAVCFPFIKYWYLLILFIFSFVCLYKSSIEIVGFGSLIAVQSLFTACVFYDILNDNDRSAKSLHIPLSIMRQGWADLQIPFWWILVAGASLQFTSAMLMIITCAFLYKKFKSINVSRDMRVRIQNYKGMFIAVTVLMMILMYLYVNNYSGSGAGAGASGTLTQVLRLLILMCYLGILVLSSVDVFYANRLSVLIGSVTDG